MSAVVNPATEETIAELESAGVEETDAAVARAKAAYPGWRAVSPTDRAMLLRRLATLVEEHHEELSRIESRNVGKAISSVKAELAQAVENFRFYGSAIASIAGCYECIEPQVSNLFKRETLSGEFLQVNAALTRELKQLGLWTAEIREAIKRAEGSVQGIDALPEDVRTLFRTAWELPQRALIDMAAARAPYIDQSQSLNLYIPADIDKWDLHMLHWTAWKQGIKSLYYCRSKSISRAGFAGQQEKTDRSAITVAPKTDYEECLACQ